MMIHRNPDTDGGRVEVFSPVGAVVIAVDYDYRPLHLLNAYDINT